MYLLILCTIGIVFLLRLFYFILKTLKQRITTKTILNVELKFKVKTLIIIGSGGHTNEMLRLIEHLPNNYTPRIYIIADTDKMSLQKIHQLESRRIFYNNSSNVNTILKEQLLAASKQDSENNSENMEKNNLETLHKLNYNKQNLLYQEYYNMNNDVLKTNEDYLIHKIPRSREVGQHLMSSIYSFLRALFFCIPHIYLQKDQQFDLLLCNGPGTCIPLCILVILGRLTFKLKTKIIFVESVCRVVSLSLSGKILYFFADQFLVQWPILAQKYIYSTYLGKIY